MLSVLCPVSSEIEEGEVPSDLVSQVEEKYSELVEAVANVDEELGEIFLSDDHPTPAQLTVSGDTFISYTIFIIPTCTSGYMYYLCSI